MSPWLLRACTASLRCTEQQVQATQWNVQLALSSLRLWICMCRAGCCNNKSEPALCMMVSSSRARVLQCCQPGGPAATYVAVRHIVRTDIATRLARYERVNMLLFAATRVPTAVIPFGVQVANFVDVLRLVRNILSAIGMTDDGTLERAGASAGRQAWSQEALAGALADVYTFAAGGAVTLGLTTAVAAGDSLATAMGAFAAVDVAFVGAVTVIAGAVAAISAAVSRPHLVRALTDLIATAQTLWVLRPPVRRTRRSEPVRFFHWLPTSTVCDDAL